MKISRDQKGFGFIEGLLIIIIIGLIGGLGWYIYQANKNTKQVVGGTSSSSTSAKKTTTKATSPTTEWKTYTSKTANATFKYPADWTVETSTTNTGGDEAKLSSKDKKTQVRWIGSITGLGGACDETKAPEDGGCAVLTITSNQVLKGASDLTVEQGYMRFTKTDYRPWLAVVEAPGLKVGTSTAGAFLPYYGGGNGSKRTDTAGLSLIDVSNGVDANVSPTYTKEAVEAYLGSADVKTAKLILESLTY